MTPKKHKLVRRGWAHRETGEVVVADLTMFFVAGTYYPVAVVDLSDPEALVEAIAPCLGNYHPKFFEGLHVETPSICRERARNALTVLFGPLPKKPKKP